MKIEPFLFSLEYVQISINGKPYLFGNKIMEQLKRGEFYGSHFHKLVFDEMAITDTEYTHDKVAWHYHENSLNCIYHQCLIFYPQ